MSLAAGYYAGYLSGFVTASLLGWIFSSFSKREVEEIENGETDDAPSEENLSEKKEHSNLEDSSDNVIYLRLSDKSFSTIFAKLKNEPLSFFKDLSQTGKNVKETPEKSETSVPKFSSSEISDDEMTGIFVEEDLLAAKSRKEKLDIGRNLLSRPVAFPTSIGGGYATVDQMETIRKKHEEYKEAVLTRSEELEIIQEFRGILGRNFYDVQEGVKAQGYTIHPLYVGKGPKRPCLFYSATTLGVRIEDEEFDSGIPSVNAKIVDIIDVGGMDVKNRGVQ
jgi:uncharacterized protein YktA (UPF0223 family)